MIEKHYYYSELLKKDFETKEACLKAEEEFQEKHKAELQVKEERKAAAAEVEKLYKEANEARKKADEALKAFLEKYHYFHSTTTQVPARTFFDTFFDNWLL